MTEEKQRVKKTSVGKNANYPLGVSGLSLQMKKTKRGAAVVVGGILSVRSLCEEEICLVSHGGRLTVRGQRLSLSSLENRTLEVFGKITGLEFGYGKN